MGNKNVPEVRFAGYYEIWEQHKLGELVEVSSASRVHKNQWTNNGVRFFRSSDVVSKYVGKENTPAFISLDLYNELSKKSGAVQAGDLLVTGGGSIGVPYLVSDNEPLYFKDADLIWLKSANKIHGYFLYFYYTTTKLRNYISSITHIGTISHYTIEQVKDTPIILPNKIEQANIGNFLKRMDDSIAVHQQELTTLKQTKQGFLQKMFPKEGETVPEVRFSGFRGEWEEIRLGDRAIIKGRLGWKSLKQEEYIQDGPSMIAGRHIKNGVIDWKAVDHIPQWRYDESPEIMLENGDVIFSKDGSLGNPALISDLNNAATINSTMMLIRVDQTINPSFYYQVMKSDKFKRLIYLKVSGSSIPHLFQADMNDFLFLAPGLEEQTQLGNFFKELDEIIAFQEQELEALKQTKQAFLQKMFA